MVSLTGPSIPSRKATLPEIMHSLLIIFSFQPLSAFKKYLSSSAWGSASLLLLACCLIHESLKKVSLIFECTLFNFCCLMDLAAMVGLKETYRFPMNPLNSLSSSEILRVSFLLTVGISLFASPHSSTLAWKIPWMEEPARLQSLGSLTVGYNWATSLSLFTFKHWRRKWQPTPVFLPGESPGQEAWWAAIYGAA